VEHRKEKAALKVEMEEALLRSQLEMAEKTMAEIGQELHDNLKNRIAYIMICLSSESPVPPDKVDQAKEVLSQVINDISNLSLSLKGQLVLDHGLASALQYEVDLIQTGRTATRMIECEDGPSAMSPSDEVILFRCAQEALHNALRHSRATDIHVAIHIGPERVWIRIRDNGIGLAPMAKQGMGLKNIRSRMALLSGTSHIGPGPLGRGTNVELEVPLAPKKRKTAKESA
jgi:signal transduction histidine kinase